MDQDKAPHEEPFEAVIGYPYVLEIIHNHLILLYIKTYNELIKRLLALCPKDSFAMKKITIFILFLLGAPQISGNNNYPIITNHDIYKLYREMYAEKVKKLTSDCEKYVQEKEVCIAKRNEIYKGTINKYEALIQDQNRSIEKINNTLDDIEKLLNEKAEVEDENFMQCIKNPTSECRKKYVHFRKAITELPETEITLKFKQAFNYSDSAH